jgi:hypothetical protein
MDLFWLGVLIFLSPFIIYVVARVLSSAIFQSYFEAKKQSEKKGGKYV